MSAPIEIPKWADVSLIPILAVIVAFLIAGLVVLGIGENPIQATTLLIKGAFGSGEGIGYTFYYATNFIFTGLAVAVASDETEIGSGKVHEQKRTQLIAAGADLVIPDYQCHEELVSLLFDTR